MFADMMLGHSPDARLNAVFWDHKRNMTAAMWSKLLSSSQIEDTEHGDCIADPAGIMQISGWECPLYKRLCDLPIPHNGRRFFSYQLKVAAVPKNDGYGLGGDDLQCGDAIYVILGCSVPVVLRQKGDRHVLVATRLCPGS